MGTDLQRIFYILFFLLAAGSSFSQQLIFKGSIKDKLNNEPLRFANVRIEQTTRGTSANTDGNFEMCLKPGNYTFIFSYIGYNSDTLSLKLTNNRTINIALLPAAVKLADVVVRPGENPAINIIRKAIVAKQKRNDKLNSYIFDSYTKGLIKTTEEVGADNSTLSLEIVDQDSAELKITGILENHNRGYYKKPDYRKDEIIARKQTANAPPTINLLTGGRLIQDFYGDDIQFFGRPLPSPLNNNALDFYYYIIEDKVAMDDLDIYQIYFLPRNTDPGFEGRIFIADNSFALMKIDVWLNRAANPGGLLDTVSIFQQFVPFEDDIYMPIDYRLNAEGNFLGIAKFGFELHSIFYNYDINTKIDDDIFDMAVVKVLPDADDKDSHFWSRIEKIPNTREELTAYLRIDSVSSVPKSFWDEFSIFSSRSKISKHIRTSGLISLYHFNSVEGHSVNSGLFINDLFDKRFNSDMHFNYGFADKIFKKDLSFEYLLGDYRTSRISLNVFDKITDLFGESNYYNKLTSTYTCWIGKYDFRHYYYTKGFNFSFNSEIFPVLEVGLGLCNRTDKSAYNNSDFSLFNKDKRYDANQPVYETKVNALTANIKLDFRKYIEDGDFRRRLSGINQFPVITLNALFSDPSFFNSSEDFSMYKLDIEGSFSTVKSARMTYGLNAVHSTGAVPFQMLYALPGNIESAGKDFTFRTLRLGEVLGDNAYSLFLTHDFNDELFRALGIPFIKDLELTLSTHFNLAYTEISNASSQLMPSSGVSTFNKVFYEAGFSLGHMLIPVEFEFTWRLNHFGDSNFAFGFNTFAL